MAAVASQSTTMEDSPANRRRSGRQIRKPAQFAEEEHVGSVVTNGSAKRKRTPKATENGLDDGESESDEEEDDEEEEEEDDEDPDEEELKEQRRASRAKKAPSKKPASKKPKTNGTGPSLAIRPASKVAPKGKKTQKARARPSQANEEGLYGTISRR